MSFSSTNPYPNSGNSNEGLDITVDEQYMSAPDEPQENVSTIIPSIMITPGTVQKNLTTVQHRSNRRSRSRSPSIGRRLSSSRSVSPNLQEELVDSLEVSILLITQHTFDSFRGRS
jgi:hypothetical protein